MEEIKVTLGFEKIPKKHTGDGQNISPPIEVEGAKGKSMAIIVDDPDAAGGTYVHWVIWNMPVMDKVPEQAPKYDNLKHPFTGAQGKNSGDDIGYDGPYPPRGMGPHHYHFKVFILNSMLDLEPGTTKDDLLKAMEGKIVQQGTAIATYER
ncbi:MAG: YbhB/YbcL family Raf kinase inhibitor-like protein [Methanomassiliicoccales archaeon]